MKPSKSNIAVLRNPQQILTVGFATAILIDTLLLCLPVSQIPGQHFSVLNALFTATSAVCVTGLAAVDTATSFTISGKTVIMILIQVGGLGFMTFSCLFALLLGKQVGLKQRLLLQEAANCFSTQGVVQLIRYIFFISISIECNRRCYFNHSLAARLRIAYGLSSPCLSADWVP